MCNGYSEFSESDPFDYPACTISIAVFSYANSSDPEFMQWWMMLLNILILSIPLVLLYGSIYVLVIAWREHSTLGQVNPRLARVIH
jgi:hypothetical protein